MSTRSQSPVRKVYGASDRLYQPTAYLQNITPKEMVAIARAQKREAKEAEYTFVPKLVSKQMKPRKKIVSDDSWRRISCAISNDVQAGDVAGCMKCDIAFSLIIRRQLCKTCDLVLCSDCNPSLVVQLGTTVTRVRQCITCRVAKPLPVPAYNGETNKNTKKEVSSVFQNKVSPKLYVMQKIPVQNQENNCPNSINSVQEEVLSPTTQALSLFGPETVCSPEASESSDPTSVTSTREAEELIGSVASLITSATSIMDFTEQAEGKSMPPLSTSQTARIVSNVESKDNTEVEVTVTTTATIRATVKALTATNVVAENTANVVAAPSKVLSDSEPWIESMQQWIIEVEGMLAAKAQMEVELEVESAVNRTSVALEADYVEVVIEIETKGEADVQTDVIPGTAAEIVVVEVNNSEEVVETGVVIGETQNEVVEESIGVNVIAEAESNEDVVEEEKVEDVMDSLSNDISVENTATVEPFAGSIIEVKEGEEGAHGDPEIAVTVTVDNETEAKTELEVEVESAVDCTSIEMEAESVDMVIETESEMKSMEQIETDETLDCNENLASMMISKEEDEAEGDSPSPVKEIFLGSLKTDSCSSSSSSSTAGSAASCNAFLLSVDSMESSN